MKRLEQFNDFCLDYPDSSMVMDLHIEGARPVTLFVRDESYSTSGRQDTTASSSPKSPPLKSPSRLRLTPHRSPRRRRSRDHQHHQHSSPRADAKDDQQQPSATAEALVVSASLALQLVHQQQQDGAGSHVRKRRHSFTQVDDIQSQIGGKKNFLEVVPLR